MLLNQRSTGLSEYFELPHEGSMELLEGRVFMGPAPGFSHQIVVKKLVLLLHNALEKTGRGVVVPAPFDVVLDEEHVVQPDVVVIEDASAVREGRLYGPPCLAVEVLSSSSVDRDRLVKKRLYGEAGIPEFWLVDPETRTAEVYGLREGAYELRAIFEPGDTLTSRTLEGIAFPINAIFE
jgi:Uma2 family endonuclease